MRVEQAIKMIENHGHKAFVTADGLACTTWCRNTSAETVTAINDDDVWFEEVTTFETYRHGAIVDPEQLYAWLGY